jgi:hypothetical protein
MTQMLLFDSSANNTSNSVLQTSATEGVNQNAREANVAAQLEHDSGMHHMGDLARLVLLRYDLVAKRRAMMAARKTARAAK